MFRGLRIPMFLPSSISSHQTTIQLRFNTYSTVHDKNICHRHCEATSDLATLKTQIFHLCSFSTAFKSSLRPVAASDLLTVTSLPGVVGFVMY